MKTRTLLPIVILLSCLCFSCTDSKDSSTPKGPERQSLPTPETTANTVASDSKMSNTANTTDTLGSGDPFLAEAAQGGMAEVELGELAAGKAQNPDVKQFAQMMVSDHGKANTELKSIADAKGVKLPVALSLAHQSKMDKLRGLSGADFDKAYAAEMVAAHEKDVAAFRNQSQSGPDPELKAFAVKTLPTLEKHLEMIRGIQSKLK